MCEGYGEVVAVRESPNVEMYATVSGATVLVEVPHDNWLCRPEISSLPNISVETDFDTARRMIEGKVSVLVVVSDQEDS